jgi:hypothetical protein
MSRTVQNRRGWCMACLRQHAPTHRGCANRTPAAPAHQPSSSASSGALMRSPSESCVPGAALVRACSIDGPHITFCLRPNSPLMAKRPEGTDPSRISFYTVGD